MEPPKTKEALEDRLDNIQRMVQGNIGDATRAHLGTAYLRNLERYRTFRDWNRFRTYIAWYKKHYPHTPTTLSEEET